MKIAHLSDLHFGRINQPSIIETIVRDVNGNEVDLVVISGDSTQRARHREFKKLLVLLDALEAPALVVPGNHDVYAWWYPRLRMVRPLDRFRYYLGDDLTPIFEKENVAILGVNSAFGFTIKGGRIGRRTRDKIARYFLDKNVNVFKILVLHHHLTKLAAFGRHKLARNAQKTLNTVAESGIDLILCGHLHVSHIEPVDIVPTEHRIVVASAGTATSSRGRKTNKQSNFYNLIDIGSTAFNIEERRYDLKQNLYIPECISHFERQFE